MYNIQYKDFGNGNLQIIKYSRPILTGTPEKEIEELKSRARFYGEDNPELLKKLMNVAIDYSHQIQDNKSKDEIRLCELSDEEYVNYLDKLDKQRTLNKMKNDGRDKKKVYDLARSNQWEWYVTITFSKEQVDRYNFAAIQKKFRKWLNHFSERYCDGELAYLFVPEQHKDGAWHYHGLIAGAPADEFVNSGVIQKGHQIYNLRRFNYGFTNCSKVKNADAICRYVAKYMSKSLALTLSGQHRHIASRNLNKPIVKRELSDTINIDDDFKLTWEQAKEYNINGINQRMNIYEYKTN